MSDDAKTGLDKLLVDLLRKPRDSFRDQLVKNAVEFLYHDFKSRLATPKVQLVSDLTRFGYRDLARKAMRGEYDDRPDAEDDKAIAKLLADPELVEDAKRLYRQVFGEDPPT